MDNNLLYIPEFDVAPEEMCPSVDYFDELATQIATRYYNLPDERIRELTLEEKLDKQILMQQFDSALECKYLLQKAHSDAKLASGEKGRILQFERAV